MQLLANESYENGKHKGLGWIEGSIKKLYGPNLKLPHMGWNNITPKRESSLLTGLCNSSYFYFLHSYYFEAHDEINIVSTTKYGNHFVSTVNYENIYGVQFHPEKSHQSGVQLLKNFSEL